MFGIVHNRTDRSLRWTNLSQAAITESAFSGEPCGSPLIQAKFGKWAVAAPDENRLDLDPRAFIDAAKEAVRHSGGLPAAQLLSGDPSLVEVAILDTFALGRHTPQAFLLLAALLTRLPSVNTQLAVSALAMASRHPDIFWTRNNWISGVVKNHLEGALRWTNDDVSTLLGLVASSDGGMQRGSFGQSVYHILTLDSGLHARLQWLYDDRRAPISTRLWSAALLLYSAENPTQLLEQLLQRAPEMAHDAQFGEVATVIREHGFLDLF